MRPLRLLLTGAALALLLAPTAARAQAAHAAVRDMTCSGADVVGTGMPTRATVHLTLVDKDSKTTLGERSVTTTAAGTFRTTIPARLNQVAMIRLEVSGPDGKEIAFADHEMDRSAPMCDLPFTGTRGGMPLLFGGGGLVALGVLALMLATRRTRGSDDAREVAP
jgi:hypothetical protein